MAITDLLSRIPIPLALQRSGERQPAEAPSDAPDTTWMAGAWAGYSSLSEVDATAAPTRHARRDTELPSWAILALASLGLTCLALAALLLLSTRPTEAPASGPSGLAPLPAAAVVSTATAAGGLAPTEAGDPARGALPADAPQVADGPRQAFVADPNPVSPDAITTLEAASNEPLHAELTLLLNAIQYGFGSRSAQLDPALRSYTARMATRFEWNPDTFRILVTAPSADLAAARASTLRRVFADAVGTGRLAVRSATGPDALTLDSL